MSASIKRRPVPAKAALNQVRKLIRWALDERQRRNESRQGSPERESANAQMHAYLLSAFLVATPFRTH